MLAFAGARSILVGFAPTCRAAYVHAVGKHLLPGPRVGGDSCLWRDVFSASPLCRQMERYECEHRGLLLEEHARRLARWRAKPPAARGKPPAPVPPPTQSPTSPTDATAVRGPVLLSNDAFSAALYLLCFWGGGALVFPFSL